MTVYYSLLTILLYLGVLKFCTRGSRQIETALVWIGITALFLIAAMRGIRIGADTAQYCSHFLLISQTEWQKLLTSYSHPVYHSIELGYRIYNKLLSGLGGQQVITVTNSFLQMLLIAILILRDSKDRYLSLLFYFTFCFYQTALNLTQSSFTSYFMFLSFPLIRKKRLIPFLIWTALGAMFHLSAIFFLPLYFINYLPFNKRNFFLFSGGGISVFIFYVSILPFLLRILPVSYRRYISLFNPENNYTIQLREEWRSIAVAPPVKSRYVLIYMVGDSMKHKRRLYRHCKALGYQVVSIDFVRPYLKSLSDGRYCDFSVLDAGPAEWVGWISHADYVFTDSFHASVFSILFHRQFWALERQNPRDPNSKNARLYSLLSLCGIVDRLLHTDAEFLNFERAPLIDFTAVEDAIRPYRRQSWDFIERCLNQVVSE